MKKVVLKCKPGYRFGPLFGYNLTNMGFKVILDGKCYIEVEPSTNKGNRSLEDFFTADYIRKLEGDGITTTFVE